MITEEMITAGLAAQVTDYRTDDPADKTVTVERAMLVHGFHHPIDGREMVRAIVKAALAAQPVGEVHGDLIARKVGDYRVTVAEDTITVSHGRDVVFAYSAGDSEPIVRQPVSGGASFARQLIDSGAYNYIGEVFDTERGDVEVIARYVTGKTPADKLAELEARQPVGQVPAAVVITPEMRAAFRKAYREGGFWNDRLDTALEAMMRAAPPAQPVGEPALWQQRTRFSAAREWSEWKPFDARYGFPAKVGVLEQLHYAEYRPLYFAPPAPAYTTEMGEAANRYHASFKGAHPLPAQWLWHELWERMYSARVDGVKS